MLGTRLSTGPHPKYTVATGAKVSQGTRDLTSLCHQPPQGWEMPPQSQETTSCYKRKKPILCVLPRHRGSAGTRGTCEQNSRGAAGCQGEGCCGRAPGHRAATALGLHVAAAGAGSQHSLPAQAARSIRY